MPGSETQSFDSSLFTHVFHSLYERDPSAAAVYGALALSPSCTAGSPTAHATGVEGKLEQRAGEFVALDR